MPLEEITAILRKYEQEEEKIQKALNDRYIYCFK